MINSPTPSTPSLFSLPLGPGFAFADETRCLKCGRVLTDPQSVIEGMGPCCRSVEPYCPAYEIVIDSREQAPFFFDGLTTRPSTGSRPVEVNLIVRGLPAGDYSISGHEGEISIERKSLDDLYGTLGRGRDRFLRELVILENMCFAAVVVECDWEEIFKGPTRNETRDDWMWLEILEIMKILELPLPSENRMTPEKVEGSILGMMMDYPGVQWMLCRHRRHAEWVTWWLLDRYWRKHCVRSS